MEAMVDSGQWWMESLLQLRDELAETHQPAIRDKVRSIRKLDGRILIKSQRDEASPGRYTFEYCKHLLERVLRTQAALPPEAKTFELISDAELLEIRRIWRNDRHDWEDSAPRIYERCTEKKWFSVSDATRDNEEDARITDSAADDHGIPPMLLRKLIDAERRAYGLRRRSDIYRQLNQILDHDWRDDDAVRADLASLGG